MRSSSSSQYLFIFRSIRGHQHVRSYKIMRNLILSPMLSGPRFPALRRVLNQDCWAWYGPLVFLNFGPNPHTVLQLRVKFVWLRDVITHFSCCERYPPRGEHNCVAETTGLLETLSGFGQVWTAVCITGVKRIITREIRKIEKYIIKTKKKIVRFQQPP